jgi:hypothetical protein
MTASGGCGPPGMVSERHRRAHAGGGVCGCEIFITVRPLSLQPPDALTISGCNYSMVTARLDVRLLGVGVGLQATRSRLEQLGRTITRPPSALHPTPHGGGTTAGDSSPPGPIRDGRCQSTIGGARTRSSADTLGTGPGESRCAVVLAGIRGRSRAATAYLFLPLVWPHGPIGRLGGPRRPRPQNWPLTRDSGGRTA